MAAGFKKVAILRKPVTALWLGLLAQIVIYRRAHTRKAPPKNPAMALEGTCAQQTEFTNLELVEDAALTYEYAVYVTDLERDASQLRGLYNPRGDNENCYDELKNH